MRWKPISDTFNPPSCVTWALVVILFPLWGPLVAILWLDNQKRLLMGPTTEWRPWFAWHPVRAYGADPDGLLGAVWLEWIERRTFWSDTEYRTDAGAR